MQYFSDNNLYTFNTGQFYFQPDPEIRKLFDAAYISYTQERMKSFYEQGHLNDQLLYFGKLSYNLSPITVLFAYRRQKAWKANSILHFCGLDIETKLPSMKTAMAFSKTCLVSGPLTFEAATNFQIELDTDLGAGK